METVMTVVTETGIWEAIFGYQFWSLSVVLGVDIILGVFIAIKEGKLNSNTGINGVLRKASCLIILCMFQLLTFLDPANFSGLMSDGLYLALMGFELLSIVENCHALGLDIPGLDKYLSIGNGENKQDKKKGKGE